MRPGFAEAKLGQIRLFRGRSFLAKFYPYAMFESRRDASSLSLTRTECKQLRFCLMYRLNGLYDFYCKKLKEINRITEFNRI